MASSSKKSVNLLGKRKPEDGLETKPFLKRHKEKETTKGFSEQIKGRVEELSEPKSNLKEFAKTLFVANLSPQTEVSDIVDFFKDVGEVVSVRLRLDPRGKHLGYGFVEFASAKEANKAMQQKNGEYLRYWKIILDQTPDFFEEASVPKKTLFIGCLSRQTEISDVIDFFKDVGQVVRVRLIMQKSGRLKGIGFVEFASAYEAKKALQKKNGEYLFDRKIFLDLADRGATYQPPRYCIDHKVWYEKDCLQRESLPIEEEDAEAMEGLDETPEEVLLIANLSPQTTEIQHIINFFKDVGEVVCVRLIVNHKGKHVGYGFVEFDTAYEAKKALQEKNGKYLHDHKIMLMQGLDETLDFVEEAATVRNKTVFVYNLSPKIEISDIISFFKDVGEVVHVRLVVDHCGDHTGYGYVEFAYANEAKKALERKGEYIHKNSDILVAAFKTRPYTRRPKYCIDHNVWYEDYLERESLLIEEDVKETPDFAEEVVVRKKTVFVDKLCKNIKMRDIVGIFKGDGEVIRVRLIVDRWGKHVGCCFVELATPNVAKKAVLENRRNKFYVTMAAEIDDPYPFRPKYNVAEKLWYEDKLRRKSLCGKKKPKPNKVIIYGGTKTTFFPDDE